MWVCSSEAKWTLCATCLVGDVSVRWALLQAEEPSTADGVRVEWKRQRRWAGFLVMGVSTRLLQDGLTRNPDQE